MSRNECTLTCVCLIQKFFSLFRSRVILNLFIFVKIKLEQKDNSIRSNIIFVLRLKLFSKKEKDIHARIILIFEADLNNILFYTR